MSPARFSAYAGRVETNYRIRPAAPRPAADSNLAASAADGGGVDPTPAEIAAEAEALWRRKGCPQGIDTEIWLEAEKDLYRNLLKRSERDRSVLADPRFSFNQKGSNLMKELDQRFPGPTGRETTSL